MLPLRVIFISVFDETTASHRFRVAKIVPLLKEKGFHVGIIRLRPRLGVGAVSAYLLEMMKGGGGPSVVVFQKTISFPLAKLAKRLGSKLVMDWDDGSFQKIDGTVYPEEFQERFKRWVGLMDGVVASCCQIQDWLAPWKNKGFIIPTCLDVDNYRSLVHPIGSSCIVGWVGSAMAECYLAPIEPALRAISRLPGVEILAVGANDPHLSPESEVRFTPWRLSLEPDIFSRIDIGIMPLPDNERARMKSGFKLLQYMAAGIPVVASPIGVNCEIVQHGWNGFLATTPAEWEKCLTLLISDPDLRTQMGRNGKMFVDEKYHLGVAADLWQKACLDIVGSVN